MVDEGLAGCIAPSIDYDIPIPEGITDAFPELTDAEEIAMRARTIQLLAEFNNQSIQLTSKDIDDANYLAEQMIVDPAKRIEFAKYPNATIAALSALVETLNHSIVKDLAELKKYTVNKLVQIIENPESQKNQITALRALGSVDGVDAFKQRSETTVVVRPMTEVERDLDNIINSLDYETISDRTVPLLPDESNLEREHDPG